MLILNNMIDLWSKDEILFINRAANIDIGKIAFDVFLAISGLVSRVVECLEAFWKR